MKNTLEFLEYRKNIYSHNGEDGVLKQLFSLIPNSNKWAVEFGGWDGKFASNCCNLLESENWNVVFIECDQERFVELTRNHGKLANAHLVNSFIQFEGKDSLDEILKRVPGLPIDLDLISMDVDGCEYHIWQSLQVYKPKVLVIEFNPTIPMDYKYIQAKDFGVNHSSGLGAFVDLAEQKGYQAVSVLDYNVIFLRKDLLKHLQCELLPYEKLFEPFREKYQTRIWQSMDGRIHLLGCNTLLWHNVTINPEKIQVLPKFMQFNPSGSRGLIGFLKYLYYNVPFVPEIYNFVVSGKFSVPSKFKKEDYKKHLTN